MGKKKHPKNQRKSLRGQNQGATVPRYRQVTELIPLDRDNQPIPVPRKELAKQMLEVTGVKTTGAEHSLQAEAETPKSDKVVSLCERRAANEDKHVRAADHAVERESSPLSQTINYDKVLFASWSRQRNVDNISVWAKKHVTQDESEALNLRRWLQFASSHPKGKNLLTEEARVPVAVRKAISMVHNPGISSTPIEHGGYVDGNPKTMPEAQSHGRPVTWYNQQSRSQAPDENIPLGTLASSLLPEEQKKQSPEVRPLPSTAPRAWAAEDQLWTMMDMVPEEHWPMDHIGHFLFKDDKTGEWHVHTGKVRTAISKQEDRIINRAVTLAFIEHAKDKDEYLQHLEEEVKDLQAQRKNLEFLVSTHAGEDVSEHDWTPQGARKSVREMDKEKYATAYAKPPKDVGKLVAEFNLNLSFARFNGVDEAYARSKYGDPSIARLVQHERQRRLDLLEYDFAVIRKQKLRMLRWRMFLRQVPTLIKLQPEHDFLAGLSKRHSKVARETYALHCMNKRNHVHSPPQKAYLSGLLVRFEQPSFKVIMNGRPILSDHVEVHCTELKYVHAPTISTRLINKALNVQHWSRNNLNLVANSDYWSMKFERIEPTYLLDTRMGESKAETYASKYEEYNSRDAALINRWDKRLDHCFETADRIISERNMEEERQRYLQSRDKPLNKAFDHVIKFGRTLKKIGDTDVFVTRKERKKRVDAQRAVQINTRKAEQEAREQAERKAQNKQYRAEVKARKKAEAQRNKELQAQREAEQRHKEIAKKLYREKY